MKFFNQFETRTIGSISMLPVLVFIFVFSNTVLAQKTNNAKGASDGSGANKTAQTAAANLPKVTQIDNVALKNLLKTNGKPLLINFWATWCIPCVEEFPELVKIDADYKGKIDFITISFDDLAEIDREVPKFLATMKAEMPAYLLKTLDEDGAIRMVSSNWQGGLPFTVMYDASGKEVFFRQGKIKPEVVRAELDKLLAPQNAPTTTKTAK